jgi:hypothetical protein
MNKAYPYQTSSLAESKPAGVGERNKAYKEI